MPWRNSRAKKYAFTPSSWWSGFKLRWYRRSTAAVTRINQDAASQLSAELLTPPNAFARAWATVATTPQLLGRDLVKIVCAALRNLDIAGEKSFISGHRLAFERANHDVCDVLPSH